MTHSQNCDYEIAKGLLHYNDVHNSWQYLKDVVTFEMTSLSERNCGNTAHPSSDKDISTPI